MKSLPPISSMDIIPIRIDGQEYLFMYDGPKLFYCRDKYLIPVIYNEEWFDPEDVLGSMRIIALFWAIDRLSRGVPLAPRLESVV